MMTNFTPQDATLWQSTDRFQRVRHKSLLPSGTQKLFSESRPNCNRTRAGGYTSNHTCRQHRSCDSQVSHPCKIVAPNSGQRHLAVQIARGKQWKNSRVKEEHALEAKAEIYPSSCQDCTYACSCDIRGSASVFSETRCSPKSRGFSTCKSVDAVFLVGAKIRLNCVKVSPRFREASLPRGVR